MSMPTPGQVLAWDLSGLPAVAASATAIADAIVKASDMMHTTIHDGLSWKGKAQQAADGKADREQAQMRVVAKAYDDLAAGCTNAHNEMEHPLAEIETILRMYAGPPVVVADDWSITGVQDWDSEAGQQLSRLSGLVTTLRTADLHWSPKIMHAKNELSSSASDTALKNETSDITQIKKEDSNAISDDIATNPTSFWAPDVPAMTASAVVGGMTDATRMGLEGAAKEAGDSNVLKWVESWGSGKGGVWARAGSGFSRIGVVGSTIGTIPAVIDDIDSGKSVSESVVSEGGGAAAGMAASGLLGGATAGAVEGSALGTVVPGAGTVAGFAVGAVAGAGASYFSSKGIQWVWER